MTRSMNGREVAMRQDRDGRLYIESLRDIYAAMGESTRREGPTCAIRHGSSSSRHVVAPGNRTFLFAGPLQSITRGSGYHEQIRCCYRDAERHSS